MKDAKGHGSDSKGAHSDGVQQLPSHLNEQGFPRPGTPPWMSAKASGPRWSYEDGTGVKREGYMGLTIDRGGTDVSHPMYRIPDGRLDIVSGSRAKAMQRVK
jgi:hypothetical protein